MRSRLAPLYQGLLDVLYPRGCLSCQARLHAQPPPLCATCLRMLERAAPEALAEELAALPAEAPPLDGAFALWLFDKGGTVQRAHHALKYGNRPQLGVALGRLIGTGLAEHDWSSRIDRVVPIPLHRLRYLERGYNQSAWLAEGVASALGCPYAPDLLCRPRPTRTQTRLDRHQRWQNVRHAFALDDGTDLSGERLLLVDDVLTTGATAAAAADVLRQAGAASVHLATLAFAR